MFTAEMMVTSKLRDKHPLMKVFDNGPIRILTIALPQIDYCFMFFGPGGKGWITSKVVNTQTKDDEMILYTSNTVYKLNMITEVEDENIDYADYFGGSGMSDYFKV